MKILKSLFLIAGMACIFISCTHRYIYEPYRVEPPFDHSFIKKIAVLEFSNYSGRSGAGRIIADNVEQYLIDNQSYKVITRMELDHILREHNLRAMGILSSTTAKNIRRIAGVDALVMGNVTNYRIETRSWMENTGYGPAIAVFKREASVSFTIKVVNTMTGEVVWSDNAIGEYWRKSSGYEYLDEAGDSGYFRMAINAAVRNHVRSIAPYVEFVKKRVKKGEYTRN